MTISYSKQFHFSVKYDTEEERKELTKTIDQLRTTYADEGYNTELTTGAGFLLLICRKGFKSEYLT